METALPRTGLERGLNEGACEGAWTRSVSLVTVSDLLSLTLFSVIYFLIILGRLTLSLMANIPFENLSYLFLAVMGLFAVCRLSPVITGGLCTGWFLLLGSPASRAWGLIRLWLMGSSQTRDWTDVPCISRQMILTHWITREVLQLTPYLTPLYSGLEALPQGKPSRTALCPSPQGNWNASAPVPPQLRSSHPASRPLPPAWAQNQLPQALWQEARAAFFTLNCVHSRSCSSRLVQQHSRVEQGTWPSNREISRVVGRCSHLETHNLQTDVSPRTECKFSGHRGRSHTHSLPSPLLRNDARCVSSTESHFLNFSFKQEITEAAYTLGSKK